MTAAYLITVSEPARAAIMIGLIIFFCWSITFWTMSGAPKSRRLREASFAVIALFALMGVLKAITGAPATLWPEGPARISEAADWLESQ